MMPSGRAMRSSDKKKKRRIMDEHVCEEKHFTVDELQSCDIVSNILCDLCNRNFSNKSAFSTHLEKVHGTSFSAYSNNEQVKYKTIAFTSSDKMKHGCDCRYYCPVDGCRYNRWHPTKAKWLPTFFSLKHHYVRNHKRRPFQCAKCSATFAIESDHKAHLGNCGKRWLCECGQVYQSKQALNKHIGIKVRKNEWGHGCSTNENSDDNHHRVEPPLVATESQDASLFFDLSDIDLAELCEMDPMPSIDPIEFNYGLEGLEGLEELLAPDEVPVAEAANQANTGVWSVSSISSSLNYNMDSFDGFGDQFPEPDWQDLFDPPATYTVSATLTESQSFANPPFYSSY